MATRVTKHASPLLLRRGIRGEAGQPLEIILHLPTAPALSVTGFEFDSAFPGAQLVSTITRLVSEAHERPDARLLVFGHADEASSDAANKALSERRAKALIALLTQDLASFDQVAADDGWKVIQYQSILKTLGIAPMIVDGKLGPKTKRGLKRFQQSYNTERFHPPERRARAHGDLTVDGTLSSPTEAALRDAYLNLVAEQLDPGRFFGPKAAGCGAFNRMGGPKADRRAVLALYQPHFPTASKIPCKEGDAGACAVNKKANHPWKCNFYRRTLEQERPFLGLHSGLVRIRLFDPFGAALASTVCTVTDGDKSEELSTDGEGLLQFNVSPEAESIQLEAGGELYSLLLHTLDAPDSAEGAASRLENLGYFPPQHDLTGVNARGTALNVMRFVDDVGLPAKASREEFLNKLLEVYGV